jgi:hypothetical protein
VVGKKQSSGGLRDNSSSLHEFKKERNFTCEWCKSPFKSVQINAKFCSSAHRLKAWRARNASKKKKALTPLDRKGKDFRPFRLVKSPPVQDQTQPQ